MAFEVYEGAISKLISEKGRYLVLDSPYVQNDLLVLLDPLGQEIQFKVFRYIYDPSGSEIKLYKEITEGDLITSSLGEKVEVELVMPGRNRGELIIVSKNGAVWVALLKGKKIELVSRIGDINATEDIEFDFFSAFAIENVVPYFTRRTKNFAGLVVKEKDGFSIVLNNELFSEIGDDGDIIEFEGSIPFWNSEMDNLDLFSYNENSGLAYLSFPVNKKNTEIPIAILNLKKLNQIPIDICRIGTAIYAITGESLYVYPDFRRYKKINEIKISNPPQLVWFEPEHKLCKLLFKGKFYHFSLYPSISDIHLKELGSNILESHRLDTVLINAEIKKLGNTQAYLINTQMDSFLGFKKEHKNNLRTHEISLFKIGRLIPSALESLQRLKDAGFDFKPLLATAEAGIPKALLRRIRQRGRFSKDDDQFIIKHAYKDLSFPEIAKELNRKPASVYLHSKNIFGSPSCDAHDRFEPQCEACQNERVAWEKSSMKYIDAKQYPEPSKVEADFDYETYAVRRKYSMLVSRTRYFQDILPDRTYDSIIELLLNSDLLKGRGVEKIFEQCIRLFLGDILNTIDLGAFQFPYDLLEIYYHITPKMKILHVILKEYRRLVNQDYHPLEELKVYFLKDALFLNKLFKEEKCKQLNPILLDFYGKLKKFTTYKDGYLAGLIYLSLLDTKNQVSQFKLAQFMEITEITLRTRKKEIESNSFLSKFVLQFNKVLQDAEFLPDNFP
ncbi:MAG: hypothetical protein ACTSQI_13840 [Candidatus Helarchaeota archaeon]